VEHGHHELEHTPSLKKHVNEEGHAFDPQDMRNMGGLRSKMKLTFWVYLIGAIALAGIPPLAGFWSKDEILAEAVQIQPAVYILLTLAAFLTAFYMTRQVIMVFFGEPRSEAAAHARENPPIMTIPLVILAVFSVFAGLLNFPGLAPFSHWLGSTIPLVISTIPSAAAAAVKNASEAAAAGFNPLVAGISTGLALLGIGLGYYLYQKVFERQQVLPSQKRPDDPLRPVLGPVFTAMNNKWWVDELYNKVIVTPYVAVSRYLSFGEGEIMDPNMITDWIHGIFIGKGFQGFSKFVALTIELGFVDALVNIIGTTVRAGGGRLRRLQTGYVSNYALVVFVGVVVIVGYLVLRIRTF
jgi:NADH-quinone oxidoreductase subunit L